LSQALVLNLLSNSRCFANTPFLSFSCRVEAHERRLCTVNVEAISNVVDVYINYLRRKLDTGSDRPLIRTIRGVGYQIGRDNQLG
jgi:Transcriptional regulatory protein, C terminal